MRLATFLDLRAEFNPDEARDDDGKWTGGGGGGGSDKDDNKEIRQSVGKYLGGQYSLKESKQNSDLYQYKDANTDASVLVTYNDGVATYKSTVDGKLNTENSASLNRFGPHSTGKNIPKASTNVVKDNTPATTTNVVKDAKSSDTIPTSYADKLQRVHTEDVDNLVTHSTYTKKELSAISDYKDDSYGITQLTINPKSDEYSEYKETIGVLDAAVDKGKTKEALVVYRGIGEAYGENLASQLKVGSVYTPKTFQETTTIPSIAGDFSVFNGSAGCIFKINVPKGSSALATTAISATYDDPETLKSEQGLVLSRHGHYEVTGVTKGVKNTLFEVNWVPTDKEKITTYKSDNRPSSVVTKNNEPLDDPITYNSKMVRVHTGDVKGLVSGGGYTKNEVNAVHAYKDKSEGINGYLTTDYHPPSEKTTANTIASIDTAIGKGKTKQDLTVFRGLKGSYSDEISEGLTVGSIYTPKTFQETTTIPDVATKFSTSMMLKINVPKGTSAAATTALTKNGSNEQGIILSRGGSYKVTGVTRSGHRTLFEVDWIDG